MTKDLHSMVNLNTLPIITGVNIYYTRMQALLIASGSIQRPQGVTSPTGKLLADIIFTLPNNSSLLVDCSQISHFEDHCLERVASIVEKKHCCLTFVNTSPIREFLAGSINVKHKTERSVQGVNIQTFTSEIPPSDLLVDKMIDQIKSLEHDVVVKAVKNCAIRLQHQRLASTPLKADIAYDARKILNSSSNYIWVSLLLADKIRTILTNKECSRSSIVTAVSLRASPFAVCAAMINSVESEIIDHMGPTPKILEDQPTNHYREFKESIYVGDFCIGGTELRIAQTYSMLRGRQLKAGVVIGSVVTEPGAFGDLDLHPLCKLNEIFPDAKYEL